MLHHAAISKLSLALWLASLVAAVQVAQETCDRTQSRDVRHVVQQFILPRIKKQQNFELTETCLIHPNRNM
jgi:hypothetical protein